MKKLLHIISFLFATLLLCHSAQSQIISYPVSAKPIGISFDSTLLTVQLAGASANPTVTLTLATGVYYIPGSFALISGSGSVAESGSLTVPVFKLTGATNPFTFTIKRRADCTARTYGLGGGTFKDIVTVDAITENAPSVNSYSIRYPTLTITQPSSLTNVALGSNINRTFSFRNSGLGCLDTVFLEIDYGTAGLIPNGNITADGISFSPDQLQSTSTKKLYKITGTPIMLGGLCESDSSITINQPVTVTGCNQVATNYKASWGNSAAQLCQSGTTTGNITVLNTIPVLNSVVVATPSTIPLCAGNPYASFKATINNTGNGPAANIKCYLGNYSGNTFQSGVPLAIDTASVLVNGVHPSGISVSVTPSWRLTKVNGSPACIVGQPGQCLITLPAGFTVPAFGSFIVQWSMYNCNGGACDDGFIASNPGIKIEYDNECGTQHTNNVAQTVPYGVNNQITNQAIQLPAQVLSGDCFNYLLDFTTTLQPITGANSPNRYAEVKLSLPVGMSIGNLATDINETINNVQPHVGFPKQVGQDVYFRFYPAATNEVKFKICTTAGGPPCGNTSIPVEITMVNDSTCPVANRITSRRCIAKAIDVLCPGTVCSMGGVSIKSFSFYRSSYGLPDNNQDGKPDATGSIDLNKIDRDRYRPGDTLHSEYRGAVLNQISPAVITNWNYLLADWMFSTGTWQGATATVIIKRSGIAYTATGVPVTAIIATKNFRINWSGTVFSPAFPAGGYFEDDSIIVAADFIYVPTIVTSGKTTTVADGNVDVPLEVLLTHVVYAAQSVPAATVSIGTTGYTCSILKYNGNIIGHSNLINLSGATGSSCNNITAGFSTFTSLLNGSQTKQYFLYEYRPIVRTDSIIYTIPAGWTYTGTSATNYNYTVKSGSSATFPAALTPLISGSSATGYSLKFDINGAYNTGIFPFVGAEGLNYNGNILFSPGCNTPDSVTISVKEYGHFISYPSKANPAAYINTNTAVKSITYSGSSKPGVVIANNTGVVEAATETNNYWDVQITGANFNAAKYVWLATEKGTGSGIDVVKVECPVGTALPSVTYGINKNLYSIPATATTGLINPNSVVVRVYFSKTGCGADSLKVRTGWDCSAFATTADNGCSQDLFLKANSAQSEIQLLKMIEPALNTATDICNDIDYKIKITSTQNGDLDNPVVKISVPTGMELVGKTFTCAYPDTTNQELLTATVAGNEYTLNLEDHSLIPSTGLKGLISTNNNNERTAYVSLKLKVNSCLFVNGSSPTFQIFGNRPCDGTAIGNSLTVIGNPILATSESSVAPLSGTIDIAGSSSITCGAPVTVTSLISSRDSNSFEGDSVIYTLPPQLKYKPGTFIITGGIVSDTQVSDNRISVSLPGKTDNTVSLQFEVIAANKGCQSPDYKVIANTYRSLGFKCMSTFGACQQATITFRDTAKLQIIKPQLATSAFSFLQVGQAGNITINYTVDITNSGNQAAPAGNCIVKIYCGSNASATALYSFYTRAVPIGAAVTHTGSFGLNVPADCFSGAPFFIQIQDTLGNNAKACLCAPPDGSVSGRVLPVKLESFTVVSKGSDVQVDWVANEEIYVARYEVEFSDDAANFVTVGILKANDTRYYSMLHQAPVAGSGYYRLKSVDEDGKFSYSEIRMLQFGRSASVSIYPNPAKDLIKITLAANMLNKPVNFTISGMDGKVIAALKTASARQTETINISNLVTGRYQVSIGTATGVVNKIVDVIR